MQRREREAENLYNEAMAAVNEKRFREAKEMLSRLKSEYAETEFVKSH